MPSSLSITGKMLATMPGRGLPLNRQESFFVKQGLDEIKQDLAKKDSEDSPDTNEEPSAFFACLNRKKRVKRSRGNALSEAKSMANSMVRKEYITKYILNHSVSKFIPKPATSTPHASNHFYLAKRTTNSIKAVVESFTAVVNGSAMYTASAANYGHRYDIVAHLSSFAERVSLMPTTEGYWEPAYYPTIPDIEIVDLDLLNDVFHRLLRTFIPRNDDIEIGDSDDEANDYRRMRHGYFDDEDDEIFTALNHSDGLNDPITIGDGGIRMMPYGDNLRHYSYLKHHTLHRIITNDEMIELKTDFMIWIMSQRPKKYSLNAFVHWLVFTLNNIRGAYKAIYGRTIQQLNPIDAQALRLYQQEKKRQQQKFFFRPAPVDNNATITTLSRPTPLPTSNTSDVTLIPGSDGMVMVQRASSIDMMDE